MLLGRPFTGEDAPQRAYRHLQMYHGISRETAHNRLEKIKRTAGLQPDDDVAIGRTGDVYDMRNQEHIGSLTDKSWGT